VGGGPGADPEFPAGIKYLFWPGNTLGTPEGAGECLWGEGCLGFPPEPGSQAVVTEICSKEVCLNVRLMHFTYCKPGG